MKRIISYLLIAVMLLSMVPLSAFSVFAEVPTYYTYIEAGDTVEVTISSSEDVEYYSFTPAVNGSYRFYSANGSDPRATLLSASGSELAYDDDSGDGLEFVIEYNCVAGTVYYIKAYSYDSTDVYDLTVEYLSGSVSGSPAIGPRVEYNSSTGDLFLGGNYIELGISKHGSFGTLTYPRTSGFHCGSNSLGMLVDGDGWDVGNAPVTGDYFVPGTPEERYILAYYYNGTKYEYLVADLNEDFVGEWAVEPTVSDRSYGETLCAVVSGETIHGVAIEITYSFGVNDKSFSLGFEVVNNSSEDITQLRFVRSFDPDQDYDIYDEYYTYNKVICNPDPTRPASDTNYAMVVARGGSSLEPFFYIAFDNRARASSGVEFALSSAYKSGLWYDDDSLPTCADEDSLFMSKSDTNGYVYDDTNIAITFDFGTLSVGASAESGMYSSLSPSISDSLVEVTEATAPTITSVSGAELAHGYTSGGPSVTATAASGHTLSYQWYKTSSASGINGVQVAGAIDSYYSVPQRTASGTIEYYYCVVTATRNDNGMSASSVSDIVSVEYKDGNHDYTAGSAVIEPTCTEYGVLEKECEICGKISSEFISPLGHDYVITETVDATCTEDGYILMTCQRDGCGLKKTQIISATNHSFGGDEVCDKCGYTQAIEHEHEYTIQVFEPTCVNMGYTLYSCDCGYSYRTDYIEQKGHDWDDGMITEEKTCTEDGVITYSCEACDAYYTAIISAGHIWEETITSEATCTSDGEKICRCTECGHEELEVIPAGHKWCTESIVSEPTCTEIGARIDVCEVCGERDAFEIPALGHSYVNGTCTRCGAKFIDNITGYPDHPEYGMYFEIDDIASNYGPDLINEYGLLLDYNEGAQLDKVAVYLTQEGTLWRRCIACTGTGITYATYVPYLSYDDDIKYTGLNSDWINIFRLSESDNGIWCYDDYATIGVNLEDKDGNLLLSLYDIGQAGAKTRIFDDLDEMIAWLSEGVENDIRGDITGDGKVDIFDYLRLKNIYFSEYVSDDEELKRADFTGDGKVDIFDCAALKHLVLS